MPILSQRVVVFRFAGGLAILAGVAALALSPLVGQKVFDYLWGVEPLALIGAVIVSVGLSAVTVSYLLADLMRKKGLQADGAHEAGRGWAEITKQYFELFHHDLGRPLARIFANGRELRASLAASRQPIENGFATLLDEIDRQTPSFRLMLSNIQVLVQLAGPRQPASLDPVEPSEVVRRIVGRYARVADQVDKEVTWWAEPTEFGIIASDSAVIEHIVTNLLDNAVRFATEHVEVRLSRNASHFFIRVWDDGPGMASQYLPHIFDRGWTPELAKGEEKVSSGLGLFIARTLADRLGGDLIVESTASPDSDHHCSFLLSLPLREPE